MLDIVPDCMVESRKRPASPLQAEELMDGARKFARLSKNMSNPEGGLSCRGAAVGREMAELPLAG